MSRILFLVRVYPGVGGVESVTDPLIHELAKDNEIFVLSYPLTDIPYDKSVIAGYFQFASEGVTPENIAFYNEIIGSNNIGYVINQGMYSFFSEIVFNKDRDINVKVLSVLHAMPGYESRDYWLQAELNKMNFSTRIRYAVNRFFKTGKDYRRYMAAMRQTYRDAVYKGYKAILLADGYVDQFVNMYDISDAGDKVCAIPNPLSQAYSSLTEPDYAKKEKLAVFVGRLAPEKDLVTLLRAWSIVEKRCPDWSLIIVGDGPMYGKLVKMADRMKTVHFAGYVSDPERFYARASMVLLTSEHEGFGMCLLEAERYGAVPVTFDISAGVRSLVQDAGKIVRRRSPRDFAEAVCSLISDESELKRLGRESFRKSGEYCIGKIADRWRALIDGDYIDGDVDMKSF